MRIGSAMEMHWEATMPQATFSVPSSNQLAHPQLQSHAMLPPPSEQIKLRKYSREDWDIQRPEITRLYEDGTLDSVMKSMRERYGLDATAKQYKDRIRIWGLNRNVRADEMESMIKIQHKRNLENKQTAFRVRKRPVNPEKIKRYMRDHPMSAFGANTDGNTDGRMDCAATPSAISYYTPSDTGPLTPHDVLSPTAAESPQLELAGGAGDGDSSGSEQTQRNIRLKQFSLPTEPEEQTAVHDSIASADLQNPSDALRILAQVAGRAENDDSLGSEQIRGINNQQKQFGPFSWSHDYSASEPEDYIHYKPLQDGLIKPETVNQLFSSYEEYFHPFFPIIPQETFNRLRLPWLSRAEPHLFSAILTVASRDNERVYQICYDHMQQLISTILAGSDANVEAVEAFLILSQWVSNKSQALVGRGEEDKLAWMYVGNALRLGYLLGIDRTSFKSESHEDPALFNRKRLVWSACYMCDIQVSVRLGKGFWSRGPGPLSGIKSNDFPTLQPLLPNQDHWALIFQANLELNQIFSNIHDVLYSSKGHNWKEMLEGRYEKYLDDFRASTRSWNDIWGTLICSPRLKASLLLTYDYLRLYINSFAYQATISRALMVRRDSQHSPNRPLPLINATAPDARFVYEAVDAAKSLLSTFNSFIDPQTLRYMPSSYYLFIVYSAVFLYKATLTTTMTVEERGFTHNMIRQTIERLEKSSVGANHTGSRYARLLQLLWRKAPKRSELLETRHQQSTDSRDTTLQDHGQSESRSVPDSSGIRGTNTINHTPSGTFSWLDLDAAWGFATQNNGVPGGTGDFDDVIADVGLDAFDICSMVDFSLLEDDNPKLIF